MCSYLGRTCRLGVPDNLRLSGMQEECVSKWMVRMTETDSCVSYFSGVASSDCSAADLRQACEETSQRFTKRDAEVLCSNLQAAHQNFWPSFWSGQTIHNFETSKRNEFETNSRSCA